MITILFDIFLILCYVNHSWKGVFFLIFAPGEHPAIGAKTDSRKIRFYIFYPSNILHSLA